MTDPRDAQIASLTQERDEARRETKRAIETVKFRTLERDDALGLIDPETPTEPSVLAYKSRVIWYLTCKLGLKRHANRRQNEKLIERKAEIASLTTSNARLRKALEELLKASLMNEPRWRDASEMQVARDMARAALAGSEG